MSKVSYRCASPLRTRTFHGETNIRRFPKLQHARAMRSVGSDVRRLKFFGALENEPPHGGSCFFLAVYLSSRYPTHPLWKKLSSVTDCLEQGAVAASTDKSCSRRTSALALSEMKMQKPFPPQPKNFIFRRPAN